MIPCSDDDTNKRHDFAIFVSSALMSDTDAAEAAEAADARTTFTHAVRARACVR